MRLSARMGLASLVLGAVLAVVFVVLYVAIGRQRDAAREARTSEKIVATAGDLRSNLLDLETAEAGFLLTGQDQFLGPFNSARKKWSPKADELRALVADDPVQARRVAIITSGFRRYLQQHALIVLARAKKGMTMSQASAAVVRGRALIDPLRTAFKSFNARETEIADARDEQARTSAQRARILGGVGLAVSLVLVALYAFFLSRSVARPVRRVVDAARGLAGGDLSARVPRREGGTEVAELGRAFNAMAGSLQDQRDRLEEQNAVLDRQRGELEVVVERLGDEKQRMARYLDLGRQLDAAETLDDLGPVILDRFADLAGAERAVLFALDTERSLAPEVIAERGLTEAPPLLPEDGVVGRTLTEGHVTRLGSHDASRLLVREPDAGPELLVPLVHGGTPAGLLVLGRREGRPSDDVVDELASQAQQAAAALASAVALRRARENATVIRAVLDTTPDAIALLDSSGRTVLENPPMRTVRQALVESVRTPGGGYRTNVSVSGSDPSAEVRDELELLGTGRTFARYAAPVRGQDDGLIGRLVVLREITGEREAERLKDEFFALVSHELRTPLTSIIGYLELVLDETEDNIPEDQRRYLEVVQRNATRLLRLVGDLLFVAQVEAGKLSLDPGSVDLGRLVDEAVEASRPRAEARGITLSAEVDSVAPTWGDRDRLGQVLDNLVTNALKFTPEGGRVTLRLRRDEGRVDLEVADTGMGIPEDEQSRLFDRFFRASSATAQAVPGVGLGLTIVKAIVEAHGGRVSLQSAPGQGTTFRVRLPLRVPEAAREDEGAADGVAPRRA